MTVSFSIYGKDFKAYEFLLAAKHLPSNVNFWDSEEVEEKDNGFTLVFLEDQKTASLPISLGRFLIANKELLKANEFYSKETIKDMNFHIAHSDIEHMADNKRIIIYIFKPKFMKLLGDLNIHFYITKTA